MEYQKSLKQSELPHQQRVIIEVNELTDKLNALNSFVTPDNAIFIKLDEKEQKRLIRQLTFMELYWGVLHERINNF